MIIWPDSPTLTDQLFALRWTVVFLEPHEETKQQQQQWENPSAMIKYLVQFGQLAYHIPTHTYTKQDRKQKQPKRYNNIVRDRD